MPSLLGLVLGSAIVPFLATAAAAPPPAAADPVAPQWIAAVEDEIRRQEYDVLPSGEADDPDAAARRARNPAQGFVASFSASGLRIEPEPGSSRSFTWQLSLEGIGRSLAVVAPPPAEVAATGNRIEFRRGDVIEWYVNEPRGVEQGFTLTTPPEGPRDAPVVVRLGVSSALEARPAAGRIDYVAEDGEVVLRYDQLVAFDADGRHLAATMIGEEGSIRLEVDDRGARYPIVIDPLIDIPAWEHEGNEPNGELGTSVGTAGDVNGDGYSDVVVGAPYASGGGQVRLFLGSPAGLPLVPSVSLTGTPYGPQFGFSVGTAGDVNGDGLSDIVIGARTHNTSTLAQAGAVVVYLGSKTTPQGIVTTPALFVEGTQAGALLGASVATAGDVNGDGFSDLVLGATRAAQGQQLEGLAYVHHGGAALSAVPDRVLQADHAFSDFGASVATAGDVDADGFSDVVVGAPSATIGQSFEGFAALHHGSAAGVESTPSWTKESNFVDARFGTSVGTAGDVNGDGYADLAVGAPGFSVDLASQGWVFVYHGSAGTVSSAPSWQQKGDVANALFGASVGTAGDVNGDGYADLAIGAPGWRAFTGAPPEGKVFVHEGAPSGLASSPAFQRTHLESNTEFGSAVATAGDVNGDGFSDVVFGARHFSNGQSLEGRAQLHYGRASSLSILTGVARETTVANGRSGSAVAAAGDVNGDGFGDWIVGAPFHSNGETEEGMARAYHGTTSTPAWVFESNQALARLGAAVAGAGDVDNDGYSDVIVGAPKGTAGSGAQGGGAFHVFKGGSAGLAAAPALSVGSVQASSDLGFSVASAGDVDGDGFCDILFGAPLRDSLSVDDGIAGVRSGANLLVTSWSATGEQAGARFGFAVASAGDVNGDGYGDVVIGAHAHDDGGVDTGRAYWYLGSPGGLSPVPAAVTSPGAASAFFGHAVAGAGDVNGDGYTDTVVGSPGANGGVGQTRVYAGGSGFGVFPLQLGSTITGVWGSGGLGSAVAGAGDFDGDGFADVITGAPNSTNGGAALHRGGPNGPSSNTTSFLTGGQSGGRFGASVAGANDENGDGLADVLIGAPDHDTSVVDGGAAFLYVANGLLPGASGTPRVQQRRATDGRPLPRGGTSPTDGFSMSLMARSPFGRGRARLQWEIHEAAGALFRSGITDSFAVAGGSGVPITQAELGIPEGLYSWHARLVHDMVTTPFLPAGRWLTPPWNAGTEADVRVEHVPPKLSVLPSTSPLVFTHELKTAPPAPAPVLVSNAAGLGLSWTAVADAPWVTVSPSAGAGLLASDAPTSVFVGIDPSKLPFGQEVGEFEATVRFQNAGHAQDVVEIPVRLVSAYRAFVPGDVLLGQIDGPVDTLAASSHGHTGMGLALTFAGATQKMKLVVTVQNGTVVKSKKVTVKPGKAKKVLLKMKGDGLYGVTVRSTSGTGPLSVTTAAKLHKLAKPRSVTLTGKTPSTLVRTLPGASLTATLTPQGSFGGPVAVQVAHPIQGAIDTTAFQQATAGGGIALAALPLPLAGTYTLSASGFAKKKDAVLVLLTPVQPPPGTSTIQLP